MTKASQRLRDEGGVVLDAAGNVVGRVGPARPGDAEGEQVANFAIASHEPSGQVDHEQAYRDLRAALADLASVLAARDAKVAAQAWDRGYSCGLGDCGKDQARETTAANPYRQRAAGGEVEQP